jgi:hypothetical protein
MNGVLFRKPYFDFLEPRSSAEHRFGNTGIRVGTHVLCVSSYFGIDGIMLQGNLEPYGVSVWTGGFM